MGILEVVLLIAGIVIFIGSFLLPSGKESGINKEAAKEEIKGLMEEEMQTVRSQMQDKMDETSEDALEKAERSLERLQEIHKNHEEAMFLYDMLNNKHANIKDTVSKMDKAVKAAEDKAKVKAEENVKTQKENVTEEQLIEVQEPAETIEPSGSPEIGFMGETAEEGQNNNEKILEMHRQGKSTVAIAKELGLGVGEVKLVIDLYKA
jgi:hypothetical protein